VYNIIYTTPAREAAPSLKGDFRHAMFNIYQ
jgi:hypothetical protein